MDINCGISISKSLPRWALIFFIESPILYPATCKQCLGSPYRSFKLLCTEFTNKLGSKYLITASFFLLSPGSYNYMKFLGVDKIDLH